MIYSSRLKKILHYCLLQNQDEYVNLDTLATILKTSKRTVFRELKDVDKDLTSYGLAIHNKSGQGIRISGSSEDKAALLIELNIQGIEYLNREERQNLLIFELLHDDAIQKLIHYANLYQVSEATISNDLDIVEEWLHQYHIELIRKPGIGVQAKGNEKDVRSALTALFHLILQTTSYGDVNYLDSQTLLDQIFIKEDQQSSIMKLLNQDILVRILDVFHMYQHELSLDHYAQTSYIGLIIHLVIAIDRILKHEELEDSEQVLAMVQDDASFKQAQNMAKYLEIEFDIDIPATEVAFIALHMKGAKITTVKHDEVFDQDIQKMEIILQQMIMCYDEQYRYYLQQDEELIHGLLTHLVPTITRLKNQLPIFNPLLTQIKEMYQELFDQTKLASEIIEKEYHCIVSDDEIGFITMHIGASLERMKQKTQIFREVNIGVVCASGIGVSALLSARIQRIFARGIHLQVFSMEEVIRKEYDACELLISTFVLTDTDVDTLLVSPLLNNQDIENIKKKIAYLQKQKGVTREVSKSDFEQQLLQLHDASEKVLTVLHNFTFQEIASTMKLNDMIQRISQTRGRDIEARKLIQEDLLKRESLGSLIMTDLEFAMLHCKSEGVSESSVDIYYPKEKSHYEAELDGIKFVIILLTSNQESSHAQTILGLVSRGLIENEPFYEAICKRQEGEARSQLNQMLREYIKNILN